MSQEREVRQAASPVERIKSAAVHERVAEALGGLDTVVRDRVREVLRARFARDLRRGLANVVMARAEPADVSDMINDRLGIAIELRVTDAVQHRLAGALRERASEAVRVALVEGAATGELGASELEQLVAAFRARIDVLLGENLLHRLFGVARDRLRDVAGAKLREGLRSAADAALNGDADLQREVIADGALLMTAVQESVSVALTDRLQVIVADAIDEAAASVRSDMQPTSTAFPTFDGAILPPCSHGGIDAEAVSTAPLRADTGDRDRDGVPLRHVDRAEPHWRSRDGGRQRARARKRAELRRT